MTERKCWNCASQRALNDYQRWKGLSGEIRRLEFEIRNCVNCADNDYATKHNWRKAKPLKREKEQFEEARRKARHDKGEK